MALLDAPDGALAAPPAGHGLGVGRGAECGALPATSATATSSGSRPGAGDRRPRRPAAGHRLRARAAGPADRRQHAAAHRGPPGPPRPGRLLAAALVAGLAWAWWPDDGHVPPGAAPGRAARSSTPCRRPAVRRCGAGSQGAATTIWPADAGPLPTADHPVLAMVMTPRPGAGSGRHDGAHLGLPVRPSAAAGNRGQPGARGQHHRRIGDVRRLVQPRLGRRLDRAEQERGVRVRQLHRLPHGRRRLPGRPRRRPGRRRRAAEPLRRAQLRLRALRDAGAGHPARGQRSRGAHRCARTRSSRRSGRSCRPSVRTSRTCRWPSCRPG